ncbi:MAG TPA: DUF4031 domain-containing protein [Solirubrobacteraceae bacterium]
MSVYVDNAFVAGDWGRWTGGGHLQADSLEELHAFAERLGLQRAWFQSKPGRPENDHYDLGRRGRELALELGAIDEDRAAGARRRKALRKRKASTDPAGGPEASTPHEVASSNRA